jgi:hypothetical protein
MARNLFIDCSRLGVAEAEQIAALAGHADLGAPMRDVNVRRSRWYSGSLPLQLSRSHLWHVRAERAPARAARCQRSQVAQERAIFQRCHDCCAYKRIEALTKRMGVQGDRSAPRARRCLLRVYLPAAGCKRSHLGPASIRLSGTLRKGVGVAEWRSYHEAASHHQMLETARLFDAR